MPAYRFPHLNIYNKVKRRMKSCHVHAKLFPDKGVPERLHDLRVGMMNAWPASSLSTVNMDAICGTLKGPYLAARVVVECDRNTVGRYLVLQMYEGGGILTLCEVQVFAVQDKGMYLTYRNTSFSAAPLAHACWSFSCVLHIYPTIVKAL